MHLLVIQDLAGNTFLFFSFFGHMHGIQEFPGQRLNPSCSCNLCHSWILNPLYPSGNS